MLPWSVEEVLEANELAFDSKLDGDEIRKFFDLFGGIPRTILEMSVKYRVEPFADAAKQLILGLSVFAFREICLFRITESRLHGSPYSRKTIEERWDQLILKVLNAALLQRRWGVCLQIGICLR